MKQRHKKIVENIYLQGVITEQCKEIVLSKIDYSEEPELPSEWLNIEERTIANPNCRWCSSFLPSQVVSIWSMRYSERPMRTLLAMLESEDPNYQKLIAKDYCCEGSKLGAQQNYIFTDGTEDIRIEGIEKMWNNWFKNLGHVGK